VYYQTQDPVLTTVAAFVGGGMGYVGAAVGVVGAPTVITVSVDMGLGALGALASDVLTRDPRATGSYIDPGRVIGAAVINAGTGQLLATMGRGDGELSTMVTAYAQGVISLRSSDAGDLAEDKVTLLIYWIFVQDSPSQSSDSGDGINPLQSYVGSAQ